MYFVHSQRADKKLFSPAKFRTVRQTLPGEIQPLCYQTWFLLLYIFFDFPYQKIDIFGNSLGAEIKLTWLSQQ